MRFLAISSLLLAAPLFAQQFPEVEPNDTAGTAQVFPLGQQCNASLLAAENDWFQFTTPGGYHTITGSGGLDTRFYLWDATATTILAFNDDSRSLTSDISMNLPAGTYLLQVGGWSLTSAGAYSLDISYASPTKGFTLFEAEPNNTVGTAQTIVDGSQVSGAIGTPALVLSDIALAGSTTTVINATAALVPGAHVGQYLRMTSGASAGFWGLISANTAATITCAALPFAPAANDTFDIEIGDVDVYQLVLTAPRSMVAFQISEGDAPWGFNHRFEIWDAAGALLVPTTTFGSNALDSGTFTGRTVQTIRCWPAGTYHIVVKHRNAAANQGGGPIAGYVPLGNYRLEVKARSMNVGGVVSEAVEPNSTVATATAILPGQQGTGNLTINTGTDASDLWGPFNITQPSIVMIQTGNGSPSAMTDTSIGVRQYDPVTSTLGAFVAITSGNTLEPAGTSHARATVTFPLPGTIFYVEVLSPGTGATQAGDYVLEISQIDATAYLTGTVLNTTANTTGCGTAGVPVITRAFTSTINGEFPTIGQTFVVQATNLNAAGNLGLMVTGLSNTLAGGAIPLPLDLTAIGAPGCVLNVDPMLIEVLVGNGSGVAQYALPIPPSATLKGAVLYQQPCKWDFATPINPIGIQPGGYVRYIIGDRAF